MAFRNLSSSSIFTGYKSSKLWDQTTFPGTFESINTIYLTSSQSTISFTNIPQTYKHLQIRITALTSALHNNIYMRFNSDSNANYSMHELYGSGSAAGAIPNSNVTWIFPTFSPGPTYPGGAIIDILDYNSSNKFKTTKSLWGYDVNGPTGYLGLSSGNWRNSTDAITSITFGATGAGQVINSNSHFALYGIRSA